MRRSSNENIIKEGRRMNFNNKRTRRIVSKIYRINLRKMSEEKVKKYSKTID